MAAPTQTFSRTSAIAVRPLITAVAFFALMALTVSQWPILSTRALALTFRAVALDPAATITLAPGTAGTYGLRVRNDGLTTWTQADPRTRVLLGVRNDSPDIARAGIAVDWLSAERVAGVDEAIVVPGATATFTFQVRAPATPGVYRIPLGLLVEGLTWFGADDLALVVASDFGFHGALVEQSMHPTLRVGELSPQLTVRVRNTGTRAWVRGSKDAQVALGLDGDDRSLSALAYAWPTPDRVAVQNEASVEPGANASFTFRVRAPTAPGTYAMRLRPVVDGVTWLAGDVIVAIVTVLPSSSSAQTQPQAMAFSYAASAMPGSVAPGDTSTITATFMSATAAIALLGVEVYTPDGASLVLQKWFESQQLAAGVERAYSVAWQVPETAAPGTYVVRLRAFASGWQTSYGSKDAAATIAVSSAPAAPRPDATASTGQGNAFGLDRRTPRPTTTVAPTAPPVTPTFTVAASASPAAVDLGSSVTIDATVRTSATTTAVVALAIYAPSASLALAQRTFDAQTFAGGEQMYQLVWPVPAAAALGTYRVSVGVFAPGLTAQYAWSDSAATFGVRAPTAAPTATVAPTASAAPTVTAAPTATSAPTATAAPATPAPTTAPTVAPTMTPAPTVAPVVSFTTAATVTPTSVAAGTTVTVTAFVTSTTGVTALVDIGIYAPDGTTRVYQKWYDNEAFVAGGQRSFTFAWPVPTATAAGTYKIVVGVFTPHWGSLYTWLDRATFAVSGAAPTATPVPTPTPGPTATPAPTFTPAPTATLPTNPSFSGLHVQGNKLVNASGQQVVLHGVNRMGTEYRCSQDNGIFDGPSDQASIAAIKSWRANAVRVPLNEHCWLGVDDGAASPQYVGESYRVAIDGFVDRLIANGLYVILDLHWSAGAGRTALDQDKMPNTSYSASFWQSVAARYANRPQVIFDLFNEPIPNDNANDNTDASAAASWQCWRDGSASGACTGSTASGYVGMQALVTAVRGTGATNVIMLGGIQWANTIWSSSARNILTYKPADPLNNMVASLHIYQNTWCNTVTCLNTEVTPVAAQMPVVAAEIGNTNCDATFMNTVMNWLDSKQLGYLAWVWNNYGATSCANIMLVLDYTGTPSVYGQIYKAHLALLP